MLRFDPEFHEQRGVKRLREQRLSISEVIRCVEQVKGEKWEQFRDRHGDEGRDLVLYLARKLCATRLKELARLAGVSQYATVAMAIKRLERRMTKQKELTALCHRVLQLLNVKT